MLCQSAFPAMGPRSSNHHPAPGIPLLPHSRGSSFSCGPGQRARRESRSCLIFSCSRATPGSTGSLGKTAGTGAGWKGGAGRGARGIILGRVLGVGSSELIGAVSLCDINHEDDAWYVLCGDAISLNPCIDSSEQTYRRRYRLSWLID